MSLSQDQVDEILGYLGEYSLDPLKAVRWGFCWGEENTELARFKEPYKWQCEYLEQLGDHLRNRRPALMATASGHGVGKSALNGMEGWVLFGTREKTRGVITANTENQLRTKTWVEMMKWYRLFIARDLFKITATSIFSTDPELAKEWRMDIVPWSEKNTEAFAGLHNQGNRIVVLFDEASAIPDIIWETTEGALTDEDVEVVWSTKGNPTRSSGRFRECFPGGRFAHRWTQRTVSGYDVPGVNHAQLDKWVADYGEDSDFCRIRIFGKFPNADAQSFIGYDDAKAAMGRVPPESQTMWPVVLGVDVGRFGGSPSVIYPRQGMDAFSRPPRVLYGLSTVDVAKAVANDYRRYEADAIHVDEGGVGGGVIDMLRHWGLPVTGVQFGGKADQNLDMEAAVKLANKRSEMWYALRAALPRLCLPASIPALQGHTLLDELTAPTYDYVRGTDALKLEAKQDLRRRGAVSPDCADALALTFAYPADLLPTNREEIAPVVDFDPFEEFNHVRQ